MPSVNDPRHENLVREIADFAKTRNLEVIYTGYEYTIKDEQKKDLISCTDVNCATSMSVRSSSDLMITNGRVSLFVDAKTRDVEWYTNITNRDFLIEYFPVAKSMALAKVGVCTLFACSYRNFQFGFRPWVDWDRCISGLYVPLHHKYSDHQAAVIQSVWSTLVKKRTYAIRSCASPNGSNDAFVVIDSKKVEKMPHWKDCIDRYFEEFIVYEPVLRAGLHRHLLQ